MRRAGAGREFGWLVALLLAAPVGAAEEGTLVLDPEASSVGFTLGATLHSVRGKGRFLGGELRFAPEGGPASGTVRIDARSFDTGIDARDEDMHGKVLLSEAHPVILFRAERLEVHDRAGDRARVTLHGRAELAGREHALGVPAELRREGDTLRAEGSFRLPYVAWGLRDLSTFVLRVDDTVTVHFEVVGRLALPAESRAAP